jgi:hypothetical protein
MRSAFPAAQQQKDRRLYLGLGVGLMEIGRHGPPMRAQNRQMARDQGGEDKGCAGSK